MTSSFLRGKKTVMISLRMPQEYYQILQQQAQAEHRPFSNLLQHICADYLERQKKFLDSHMGGL